jgi:hypothetical protein
MTENELLNIGFEKCEILNTESNNGYDYYYYFRNLLNGVSLISIDSDQVKNNSWSIKSFDIPDLKITDLDKLKSFIAMMENVTRHPYG